MKGWTVKKIILRCFFATGLFYLHEKFQLWQSSPSHFFIKKMAFFIIFVGKIFFLQNIYGFTPVKKVLSHLDQKWAQAKQLLSKKFQLPIAMEGCIVAAPFMYEVYSHVWGVPLYFFGTAAHLYRRNLGSDQQVQNSWQQIQIDDCCCQRLLWVQFESWYHLFKVCTFWLAVMLSMGS